MPKFKDAFEETDEKQVLKGMANLKELGLAIYKYQIGDELCPLILVKKSIETYSQSSIVHLERQSGPDGRGNGINEKHEIQRISLT